jgi:hypothetical protein
MDRAEQWRSSAVSRRARIGMALRSESGRKEGGGDGGSGFSDLAEHLPIAGRRASSEQSGTSGEMLTLRAAEGLVDGAGALRLDRRDEHRSCLYLFNDDSSLLSAVRMDALLRPYGIWGQFALAGDAQRMGLSDRQIENYLGREPDFIAPASAFMSSAMLGQFDYVHSAKFPKGFRDFLRAHDWRSYHRRPCFVSTFPGLELLPNEGLPARSVADVLCFNNFADMEAGRERLAAARRDAPPPVDILRFNPLLLTARSAPPEPRIVRTLVFFVQSALPASRAGRQDVADLLRQITVTNPACRVLVKLRHLRGEDRHHTHREYVSFQALLAGAGARVECVDISMERALRCADAVLTCSSTAGLQALAQGVPAMFYDSYPDHEHESQWPGVRRLLTGSNLVVSREQAVRLDAPRADPRWFEENLSTSADLAKLVTAMRRGLRLVQADCAA